MDEGYDTQDGPNGPSNTFPPADLSHLSPEEYQTWLLEQHVGLLEANLEASMRIYDTMIALLAEVTGSMSLSTGLIEQHREGKYYFPPFTLMGMKPKEEE